MSTPTSNPPPETNAQNATSVVASAIASGGLVGAGLAILALQLPVTWQPVAIAIVPTLSSACAVIVRTIAVELRRRNSVKQWHDDRETAIAYVDYALPACQTALKDLADPTARKFLEGGMARMQRVKALVLTALPGERPWLDELTELAAEKVPRFKKASREQEATGFGLDEKPSIAAPETPQQG